MATRMSGRGRGGTALAFTLLILASGIVGPFLSTAQPVKTSVTLTLSPNTGYIDPDKDNGATTFTATVSVRSIPLIATSVNITADSGYWANETSVPSMVITGSKDQTFTVKVFAPYNVSAGDSQELLVIIKWSNTLNEKGTAQATAQAVVNQSYDINMWVTPTTIYTYAGKSGTTTVYVGNAGNGPDSLSIQLVNNSDLTSAGWTFALSKTKVDLQQDEQASVVITAGASSKAEVKTYKFQVRATSEGAKNNGRDVFRESTVTVSVRSSGGGTGNGNTTQNKTKPVCSFGLIPASILLTVGSVFYGVAAARPRRPRILE